MVVCSIRVCLCRKRVALTRMSTLELIRDKVLQRAHTALLNLASHSPLTNSMAFAKILAAGDQVLRSLIISMRASRP